MGHQGVIAVAGSTNTSTGVVVLTLDAKAYMRIASTETAEDTVVAAMVSVAARTVEERTRRALLHTEYDLYLDAVPTGAIEIPISPLASVTSITSYDSDDTATTMSSSEYQVDVASEPGRVIVRSGYSWPSDVREAQGIRVRFVAGYGATSTSVPAPLVQAVRLLAGGYYEHREEMTQEAYSGIVSLPSGVSYLLEPYELREWG
jgi:uncharacterized phiE125 gp8 family phage protein